MSTTQRVTVSVVADSPLEALQAAESELVAVAEQLGGSRVGRIELGHDGVSLTAGVWQRTWAATATITID